MGEKRVMQSPNGRMPSKQLCRARCRRGTPHLYARASIIALLLRQRLHLCLQLLQPRHHLLLQVGDRLHVQEDLSRPSQSPMRYTIYPVNLLTG